MSYKKVLIAVNVYEDFDHIINSAKVIIEKFNSSAHVITVIDNAAEFVPAAVDFQKNLHDHAKKELEEIRPQFAKLNVHFDVIQGNPNREIVDYSIKKKCDLIIIGSHGRHGINLLLGSTANSVLHKAKTDVLTIRVHSSHQNKPVDYKKILLTTDLEPDSDEVAKLTKEVAMKFSSNISVITIQPEQTIVTGVYGIVPEVQNKISSTIENNLSKWCAKYRFNKTYFKNGNCANEITRVANEKKYDLIIAGSHQRSTLGRIFLGSTANAILHHAQQDVLVKKIKNN